MGKIALDGHPVTGGMVAQTPLQQNARDLEQELSWFARVLDTRFKLYFGQDADGRGRVRDYPSRSLGLGVVLRALRAAL